MIFISNNRKLATLSAFVLIPLLVGFIANYLTNANLPIYPELNKPPLSPPAYIFPIVWTILYALMGISSYIIYASDSILKYNALKVYSYQLIVNFLWSIVFFGLNNYFLAFLLILVLIALIAYMIYLFIQINKTAGYLQIPYLLWCIFAAYLNLMIVILN